MDGLYVWKECDSNDALKDNRRRCSPTSWSDRQNPLQRRVGWALDL